MNMHLSSLLLCVIVSATHKTSTASPLYRPDDTDSNSTNYYDGYPEKQQLETYSRFLLGHFKVTGALSTANLALWNRKFDNENEASQAAAEYLLHKGGEITRGCLASYRYDYNKYRFPSTIIVVDCNSTRNYCDATQEDWPTSGSCLGHTFYLTTLIFQPDPSPLFGSVDQEQHTGVQMEDGASGEFGQKFEDLTGKWSFETKLENKGCLCLAK